MTCWRRWAAVSIALTLTLGASPAWAGPPTEQLKAEIDRVLKVLEDPELKREGRTKERRATVRKIANDIFDFTETAKRSLARHWAARTPAEREEFVTLFSDLLERSYLSRIELYGGERIGYLGETVEGELAVVRTRIVTKEGSEVPIEYRMLKRGTRWLVYDVIIEGVSLIANYRAQFNKIITTSSYQELVKRMKTKQDEFHHGEQAKRAS